MDFIYTTFFLHSVNGNPIIKPIWGLLNYFKYDKKCLKKERTYDSYFYCDQAVEEVNTFIFGDTLLVKPIVTGIEHSNSQ